MKPVYLVIAFLFVFSQAENSFAQENGGTSSEMILTERITETKTTLSKLKKQIDDSNADLKPSTNMLTGLENQLKGIQGQLEKMEPDYKTRSRDSFLGLFEVSQKNEDPVVKEYRDLQKKERGLLEDIAAHRKAADKIRLDIKQAEAEYYANDISYKSSQRDYAKLVVQKGVQKAQEELAKDNERLKLRTEVLGELEDVNNLSANWERLHNRAKEFGLDLEIARVKHDTTMLGEYVRDRMAKLVNSDSFCSAAKECVANRKPQIKPSDLNSEVFKGMTDSPKRVNPPPSSAVK